MHDMSEEQQESEVVIEKGKQCSIEHAKSKSSSRSRQKQVKENSRSNTKKKSLKGQETHA
eukprot:5257088-Ditylum_brightwellii.AAC.1